MSCSAVNKARRSRGQAVFGSDNRLPLTHPFCFSGFVFLQTEFISRSLVLLFRAVVALLLTPFRAASRQSFKTMVHVKWGRDVLHFPVPPSNTTLGKLRADIAEYTHLPPSSFKLVHGGAVMKDDYAPLSAYKIRENSTIALIGGHTSTQTSVPQPRPPRSNEPPTEQGTIGAIRAELDRVRSTLVPDVDAFVLACSGPVVPAPHSSTSRAPAQTPTSASFAASYDGVPPQEPTSLNHSRLSELLLQSLLRLDALHLPGADWPEARQQRKAAVREVQGVLDRLDNAWASR
ncbi:hypothetical protein EDD15DRAFT_1781177 [Pisolithus albus]|nr:hypothetical protein EDD15DRAFT_1781177 [Pisolithus albus]